MKKIFFKTAIILLVILCASFSGFSQGNNELAYQPISLGNDITYYSVTISERLPSNDANMKAVRDFAKQFKGVNNAEWYQVEDGFMATFTENEIVTKVAYDPKGNWHSTLRTYSESKLPFDIRGLVKSKYYDYSILVVYEITHPGNLTYIMKIEDSKNIKTLRVSNGEIEVIGDYTRG